MRSTIDTALELIQERDKIKMVREEGKARQLNSLKQFQQTDTVVPSVAKTVDVREELTIELNVSHRTIDKA